MLYISNSILYIVNLPANFNINEKKVANFTFYLSLIFFVLNIYYSHLIQNQRIIIITYSLIIAAVLLVFVYLNNITALFDITVSAVAFTSVNLGIFLAATQGLHSSEPVVLSGLSRIILALFLTWKLTADMRYLSLTIDPFAPKRGTVASFFYGLLYPRKELIRLIKVLTFVAFGFYLVVTGLNLISSGNIDLSFFQKTEKISLNIIFLGIQAPMMMASRASISNTFSNYLKNLQWMDDAMIAEGSQLTSRVQENILNSSQISYDSINSNGKHLWLSVFSIIFLQANEGWILNLDIVSIIQNFDINQLITHIVQFFLLIFQFIH